MTTTCSAIEQLNSTQRSVRIDQVLANQPPITRARYWNNMESSRSGRGRTARSTSESRSRSRTLPNSNARTELNGESSVRQSRQRSDNSIILDVQIAQNSLERHQYNLRDAILQNTLNVSVTPSPVSTADVQTLANTSVNINQTNITEPTTDALPDIISSNSMRRPSISIIRSSGTVDNQDIEKDCSECCVSLIMPFFN